MRAREFIPLFEAAYAGNIGLSEIFKFYGVADAKTINYVDQLIRQGDNIQAWDIIQNAIGGDRLIGAEFGNPVDN